jgi:uncharacterized membrane protein
MSLPQRPTAEAPAGGPPLSLPQRPTAEAPAGGPPLSLPQRHPMAGTTWHDAPMEHRSLMELVVRLFEAAGVLVLAIGSFWAVVRAGRAWLRRAPDVYPRARQDMGRAILMGLEVLIIADIVQTVTIDPTVESALTLGVIVLVRTFLSFSLEIELDGVVPWRRRAATMTSAPPPPEG